MLLVIDVGNTTIVFGVYKKNELVHDFRISTVKTRTSDEYGMLFYSTLSHANIDPDDIEDVIIDAKNHGLKVIAITDHDTVNHYDEIYKYGKKHNMKIIKGVEMSCYDFDVYKKVHVVGLWLNEETPNIEKLCNHTLHCRNEYHKELIENLRKQGYDISYDDAKKFSPYSIVFKMNIFQALKEKYPEEMTPQRYKELFASKTSKETDMKMGYIDVKEGI